MKWILAQFVDFFLGITEVVLTLFNWARDGLRSLLRSLTHVGYIAIYDRRLNRRHVLDVSHVTLYDISYRFDHFVIVFNPKSQWVEIVLDNKSTYRDAIGLIEEQIRERAPVDRFLWLFVGDTEKSKDDYVMRVFKTESEAHTWLSIIK